MQKYAEILEVIKKRNNRKRVETRAL